MRERVTKGVLLLIGTLFVAGIYPLVVGILRPTAARSGETMMLSLYVTLGVFLLMAFRKPANHRSLIAFAAWSSFAHAATMLGQTVTMPNDRQELLGASLLLIVISAALGAVVPARKTIEQAPAITV